MNWRRVGAVHRSTCSMSRRGASSSTTPMIMMSTWVARSATARTMLRRAASLIPITLITTSDRMTTMPPIVLYGHVRQHRPEHGQVVGHEERRDGDRDDVVEHERPAGAEAHELVEGPAREARRAAGLGQHGRRLRVGPGGGDEEQPGQREHDRREAHGVGGHDAQRVVDRRPDVAVRGAEERRARRAPCAGSAPLSAFFAPWSPALARYLSVHQRRPANTSSSTPAMSWMESGQTPPQAPRTMSSDAEDARDDGDDLSCISACPARGRPAVGEPASGSRMYHRCTRLATQRRTLRHSLRLQSRRELKAKARRAAAGPPAAPLDAGLPRAACSYLTRNGMTSRATMLMTLIIGLMAGPAVSL